MNTIFEKGFAMIVDIHTHMIRGKDLDAIAAAGGESAGKAIESSMRQIGKKPQATEVAARVAQLDRFHYDYQLATPVPTLDPSRLPVDVATEVKVARAVNDSMARITEDSKGRILCAGAVPMSALTNEGPKEMERAMKNGLKGFSLMTNIKGKPLDAAEFRPFWALASKLNAAVFIHPVDPVGKKDRAYEDEYDLMHVFGWPFESTLTICRLVFSGIMEEFPNLKIVTHHLGGMIPFYWGRIEESYVPDYVGKTNVKLKKSLKENFSKFFYDTAVANNPGAIKCSYAIFGADQIVFATDAPFGPGSGDDRLESYPKIIKGLGLSAQETDKIMGGNGKKILGIE